MAIQSLFGPSPAQVMEQRKKEQEQEIMQQGGEFGEFAPLYRAGLRFNAQGRQSLQSMFPGQQDAALQEATAVQSVLAKYQGQNIYDPSVLTKIAEELGPIAPNAGVKALTLANELTSKQKTGVSDIDPSEVTPESLNAFVKDGSKNYSLLKFKTKTGEGTEFERLIASLPPEEQKAAKQQRLKQLTEGSGMPIPLVMYSLTEAGKVDQTAFGIQQLDTVLKDFESGTLELSLKDNFANQVKTLVGKSDEGSRAYSNMQTTLEELRNARLNLNIGVQTEGDALRAINEFLANYDRYDTKTALQQFKKVRAKMATAYQTKQNRLKGLYTQYNTNVPEGMFPSIETMSSGSSSSSIPDSVIEKEFNDPKNAKWKDRGYEAFKEKFLKIYK
jgi:hypothetical protein